MNIVISDLSGKQVFTATITAGGVSNFDISTLENGAYLLHAGNDKFKLMIAK